MRNVTVPVSEHIEEMEKEEQRWLPQFQASCSGALSPQLQKSPAAAEEVAHVTLAPVTELPTATGSGAAVWVGPITSLPWGCP